MLTQSVLSGSILDEEIALEEEAIEQGIIRYRQLVAYAVERGDGAALKPAERLILHWLSAFVAVIKNEQEESAHAHERSDRLLYGQAIRRIDAERLAVLTMREVLSSCMAETNGVKMATLAYAVGRAALGEAHRDELAANHKGVLAELDKRFKDPGVREFNWKAGKVLDTKIWDKVTCTKLGVALVWMMIQVATVGKWDEEFKLAFHHERRRVGHARFAYLRMDERAFEIIEQGHEVRQFMRPRYLPMIVRPLRWVEETQGGYVRIRTPFISKPTGTQRKALQNGDLDRVFAALDDIAGTPWRVNPMVHHTMKEVWARGGTPVGDPLAIPPAQNLELPPKPHDIGENPEARLAWRREARRVRDTNIAIRSERCEFLHKLTVADRMQEYEQFYFPHQFDFRGRCYPVPPHLQHQGDDVCRGLLECADARPVGERGLYWLKIHAANVYGQDKLPYQMRHDWTEANMASIHRAVADPLGDEWWRQADKPWQFLAACYAVVYPAEFGCRLPVQIDGTCNGLQHYAALGRDSQGAAAVNMMPGNWPSDIYSSVAGIVQSTLAENAADGHAMATLLAPLISRKVVKQPVMTSVYGVTMVGARKQVAARLEELGVGKETRYEASMYLANVILSAIRELCAGASDIMDWMRTCAGIITKTGEPVRWTTPLGLPVVQPYRKYHKRQIRTLMQNLTLLIEDEAVPVSPRRQADGVAPNFVHSIDATHMMMTARRCAAEGVWFAGVHDSYWTHAATTDQLARGLRAEFVALHEQPLLIRLAEEWRRQLPDIEIPDPPEPGDYRASTVLDAPYFFN